MALPIRTAEEIARFATFEVGMRAKIVGNENSVVLLADTISEFEWQRLVTAIGRWSFTVCAENSQVKIVVY